LGANCGDIAAPTLDDARSLSDRAAEASTAAVSVARGSSWDKPFSQYYLQRKSNVSIWH